MGVRSGSGGNPTRLPGSSPHPDGHRACLRTMLMPRLTLTAAIHLRTVMLTVRRLSTPAE